MLSDTEMPRSLKVVASLLSLLQNSQSTADGKDTDDNKADFSRGTEPDVYGAGRKFKNSGELKPDEPTSPAPEKPKPDDPAAPYQEITPIADIQGTGDKTPLEGKTVTTEGVVTAMYPSGGFNGLYIQTPGTGGTHDGKASHGLFLYDPKGLALKKVAEGDYVRVTGTAAEYYGLTQLKKRFKEKVEKLMLPILKSPKPTVDEFLVGDEAREKYEGMLATSRPDDDH